MNPVRRVAAIEPYCGASHQYFLTGLQQYSQHNIELHTLPARMWKWRMRGAALHLARAVNAAGPFDLLLCSDFVNVADLRALLLPEPRSVPVLLYMHENQMTYPLSPDEEFDPYFGFTNILSCLAAEAVVFNSEFHRREFLTRLPGFLPRLPDYEPRWVIDTITAKAEVLPVGLDVEDLERHRAPDNALPGPPHVLWNHRWEFDKQPERFFAALEQLASEGVPFVADVAGSSFARRPAIFDAVPARLGERLGQFGFVAARSDYVRLLWQADVVVSTASQEFFGIAMAEAVVCGAHPIAPRALVYEELYGGACAAHHLYRDEAELLGLLRQTLTGPRPGHACGLAERLRQFDWRRVAPRFDARIADLIAAAISSRRSSP